MVRTSVFQRETTRLQWVARRLEEALFMAAGAALALPLILPFA